VGLDVVVHTYNPSSWKLRQEDYEFKFSLGNTVRSCLKKKKSKKRKEKEKSNTVAPTLHMTLTSHLAYLRSENINGKFQN
jgi:hypothetical protein